MALMGLASLRSFTPKTDSSELIDYLDKNKQDPLDAIFVDIRMPLVDGAKILRIMKLHPQYNIIPVILISAWKTCFEFVKIMCPDFKADGYLLRPISLAELSTILEVISTGRSRVPDLGEHD